MAISTAIDLTRVSRAVGYKVKSGIFSPSTPYLPQRIAVLAEANAANQSGLDENPIEFINAAEVAEKAGYGSPAYQIARILRPVTGNVLGGIPTVMYLIPSDGGATQAVFKLGVTVATTVTENATHKLIINGRNSIDGKAFTYNVVKGEDAAAVRAKIIDAVNAVLASPVTASLNVDDVDLTSKWGGKTAILSVEVDMQNKAAGVVYAEVSNTVGTGVVDISDALAKFGEEWNTTVINSFGEDQFDALEQFNGIPDPTSPTGRWIGDTFKPFMAFFGSTLSDKDDIALITDDAARKGQVTNVLCPAPNSKGFPFEAAANMAVAWNPIAQNEPHSSPGGKSYIDMPIPSNNDVGDFASYDGRDFLVKAGSSTAYLVAGAYQVQDLVTTYHPDSEPIPKFRYVRDVNIDMNMGYKWKLIMIDFIQDKAIVQDGKPVRVQNTISPKQVKQLISAHALQSEREALIVDADFTDDSALVEISGSNPARLDIFFRYKRTSTANIVSTDAEVDFAFTV